MLMGSTEEDFSCFTTKGRRTKRQRSLLVASTTSSHRGGSDDSYGGSSSSPSRSDEHDVMSAVTSEEEDMANCLILLAQGIKRKTSKKENVTSIINKNNFGTSYECKTCNKTFSSFQALGGHRTSHKKIIKPPSSTPISSPDHHEDHRDVVVDYQDEDFTTSVKKIVEHHQNHKARVHECSICGSEFPSGQALGGHMRRHRAAVPLPPPVTTVSLGFPVTSEVAGTVVDSGGPGNILCLDLNLPAPDDQDDDQRVYDEDDHHVDNTFVHVLPRMSLLDCHY